VLCLCFLVIVVIARRNDPVLLSDVKALTFHKNQLANSNRTKPVAQLNCHGQPCSKYQPDVVQCQNVGDSGDGDVQWRCSADLDSKVKFGPIDVNCEGFSEPNDQHILKDSCVLRYELKWTGKESSGRYHATGDSKSRKHEGSRSWILPLIVVGFLIFGIQRARRSRISSGTTQMGYPLEGADHAGTFGRLANLLSPQRQEQQPAQGDFDFRRPGGVKDRMNEHDTSGTSSWGAMAASGALGYMLGRRGKQSERAQESSSGQPSSSSRVATGYGGTSRR